MSELQLDSQAETILRHLRSGRSITPLSALRLYGCMRLGARIWDLKRAGHAIDREWESDGAGKRWAKYSFAAKQPDFGDTR